MRQLRILVLAASVSLPFATAAFQQPAIAGHGNPASSDQAVQATYYVWFKSPGKEYESLPAIDLEDARNTVRELQSIGYSAYVGDADGNRLE